MGGSGLLSSSLPFSAAVRTIVTCNKRKDATTSFGAFSFSVFRSASPYRSVFLFFWLLLLLYFRRSTLRLGRLAYGQHVL
ncbi:hypothetical protein Peur_033787 [Populus x canadensis]